MESRKVVIQRPRTRTLFSFISGPLSSKITYVTFPLAIMDTFQPVLAFNAFGVNVSSAKALIEEYDRELSAVDVLVTRVEDDRREAEKVLLSSKEAMQLQLQHQIYDLRLQELVEFEQLEATSQARMALSDEIRKSILAKVDAIKRSISPIQNLSIEILGHIFRQVVALDVAPWLLTIVNKTWRGTALTDPWLWSNIRVGQESRRVGHQTKWLVDGVSRTCCGRGLVCRNLDELAYFVDKSGAVPLDIQVHLGFAEYEWTALRHLRVPKEAEWVVLRHLIGPQLSSRVGPLSMSFGMDPEGASGWILGLFPLLQNLSYGSPPGSFIERVMARARQLKDLTAPSLPHNLTKYPFWNTLRTLNLAHHDPSELNQIISKLPLIEVIKGSATNWPNIDTPVVTLQHIKFIELTCPLPHIAHLRLPRLEKLAWFDYNFPYDSSDQLDFPTDTNWSLSLPNLVEIEAGAPGEAFAVVLREFPNVHTALLRPIHSKDSKDSWALDLIESLIGAGDMLCPKLRHLTLKRLKADKALAEPLIRRLIISRKALGVSFKHFQIVWAKHSGKREESVQYALLE